MRNNFLLKILPVILLTINCYGQGGNPFLIVRDSLLSVATLKDSDSAFEPYIYIKQEEPTFNGFIKYLKRRIK